MSDKIKSNVMFPIRSWHRVAILASFFLFLSACSSDKLNPLHKDDVILAFGDSLTSGVGTNEQFSYPEVLSELSGRVVINAGVSGETTGEGLVRFPDMLEMHDPSLVILMEGGNDILRNRDYSSIERNLDAMISLAQNAGVQVVLIGVPEKRLFSSSAPFYERLAEKHGLVFEPKLIGSLMRSPGKKSDPIHFNKEGYRDLADGIYQLLADNGAFN